MSTVLDALKKIQSDRDRGGISESGALHQELVGAVSPTPAKRRWVIWVASLGVVAMVGAAAGFLLLWNGDETTVAALDASPSGRTEGGLEGVRSAQVRSQNETRAGEARAARRPGPSGAPAPGERAEEERQRTPDAVQNNLTTGARVQKALNAGKTPGARAEARLPAAGKEPDSLSSDAGSDVADPEPLARMDSVRERSVTRVAQSDAVDVEERRDGPKEGKEWEAGSGSVRMAARTPGTHSPGPGPEPGATPAPESKPAPRAESKPAPRAEPEPTELLAAPLATALLFPEVSLEAVRWHPDAERREARLIIDNCRPVDVREGDIIAGVAVQRIEPGAVELAMGTSRMRVRIGE